MSRVDNITLFDPDSGFCNWDPATGTPAAQAKFNGCGWGCMDGRAGFLCTVYHEAYCVSQCSGHGYCSSGYCEVRPGCGSPPTAPAVVARCACSSCSSGCCDVCGGRARFPLPQLLLCGAACGCLPLVAACSAATASTEWIARLRPRAVPFRSSLCPCSCEGSNP